MRGDKRIVFVLVLVLSLQLVIAGVDLGNLSYDIDKNYASGEALRGWVNISIEDVNTNSLITAFDSNISLKEFLDLNIADYSCFPVDCMSTYITQGDPFQNKDYSVSSIESILFGLKITEKVSDVSNFEINISSNAGNSCLNPLKIDLLDDGNIDWRSSEIVNEECFISKPYGCYNSSDKDSSVNIALNRLCGEIELPPAPGYKIGANIERIDGVTGNAGFALTLEVGENSESCTETTSETEQTINCNIQLEEPSSGGTGTICISANAGSQDKYTIDFEDIETCGYIINENDEKLGDHDYELFAKPLKYKSTTGVKFNQQLFDESVDLNNIVKNHIQDKYQGNCSSESSCIVPIRVFSGTDQTISIDGVSLDYDTGGQNPSDSDVSDFYELVSAVAKISSGFLKLDLLKANLLTPEEFGEKDFTIDIAGTAINEKINISRIPKIVRIHPREAGLMVPTRFIVFLDQPVSNNSNLTFSWNFGDGNIKNTNKNYVEHRYIVNKTHTLTVNVSNEHGSTSKEFLIPVRATYDVINDTIVEYKKRIKNVKNKLVTYPDLVKSRIEELKEIDLLKSSIDNLEKEFKQSLSEDYVEILIKLNDLKVPKGLDVSFEISSVEFVQNKDRFDVSTLADFGGLSVDSEKSGEDYYNAVNNWLGKNMKILLKSKTYTLSYDEGSEDILSDMEIELKPNSDLDDFYVIIPGELSQIKFKPNDYSTRDLEGAYGIRLSSLLADQSYKIGLLHPEKVTTLNPPVYLSPDFRLLQFGVESPDCNNNGKCEAGENINNCRTDCKPWGKTWLFLGILFLVAFIIYIILQEWYKRNYEKSLFKNKNQLFNVLTFMNTTKNQGMTKSQIFSKLRSSGWSLEKLNYAWNKLSGKRTGMFEIPILKPFEKMKMKKEIQKRKGLISGKLTPPK